MSLGERLAPVVEDLWGMQDAGAVRLSSSRLLMSPGLMAMETGTAVLQMEKSVISVRRKESPLMAGLALSSSSLPTMATLQLEGEHQDWPARRQGRMG